MSNLPEQPTINPTQFQVPVQKPQDKQKRGILFLEWGLFEVVFVLVVIAIIFGALNFLNILNISKVFPQLSFLPHLQTSQSEPVSTKIQVNRDPQSQELVDYIKSILKPNYLPFNIDTPSFATVKVNNFYEADWSPQGSTISATLSLDPIAHKPLRLLLSITPLNISDISTNSVEQAEQKYLLIKGNNFNCGQTSTISFCENFDTEKKSGFGISEILKSKQINLFSCKLFPQNNNIYQNSKSCLGL